MMETTKLLKGAMQLFGWATQSMLHAIDKMPEDQYLHFARYYDRIVNDVASLNNAIYLADREAKMEDEVLRYAAEIKRRRGIY